MVPGTFAPRRSKRLAVAAVLALVGGCGDPAQEAGTASGREADGQRAEAALAPRWVAPPAADEGARCSDCHPTHVAHYLRSGMARALGPVVDPGLEGLATRTDGAGLSYTFEGAPGAPRIVERSAEHELALPLAFAIGAGELDRSFAARLGNTLVFAPLEVVTHEDGRSAELAPGHTMRAGQRFTLAITPECLGCHTDRPPPRTFPLNLAPPASWEPRGISCGACHGRVEAHALWQEADLAGEAVKGRDPVLRAGGLTRWQRLSVCAACHLQGDARIVLEAGVLGPPAPGGDLLDQRAVYVAEQPTNEIGFVSQVERLVLSRCFLETDDLTCESCHDPHRGLFGNPTEKARVRAACTACHAANASPPARAHDAASPCSRSTPDTTSAQDCVACHMRTTGVFDVDHVEIHDHFIRARPGPASERRPLRVPADPDGNWKRFVWPGAPAPAHVNDPGLRMMAWAGHEHEERALTLVDADVHPRVARLAMYHHVRGSLLERTGRTDDAMRAYRRALELDPELVPAAANLALLLGAAGHGDDGSRLLDDVLARHPSSVAALRNRAVLRFRAGDSSGFARDLETALAIRPDEELARTLADFWRSLGDVTRARRWDEFADGLGPRGPDPQGPQGRNPDSTR